MIILLLIFGIKCGINEVFKRCGSCDGSCTNPDPICPAICKKGCVCRSDFVRNKNNTCIDGNKCP
uniref:TIL domain-containing protein n=1 Tax=Meloidogyne incognita TaxID=6306 RepID=A0A914N7F8_MELIC